MDEIGGVTEFELRPALGSPGRECGGSDLLHDSIHDAQDVAGGVLEAHRLPVSLYMHVTFHSGTLRREGVVRPVR